MSQVVENQGGIGHRKKKKQEADIDITPMIDIVFLLLAFFVIVSKMDPSAAVEMPPAKYGVPIADSETVVLVVRETESEVPEVYLGKNDAEENSVSGGIEDVVDAVAQYVEREFAADAEKTKVLIKAERKVKSRHVSLVKDAVSQAIDEESGQRLFVGVEEN